MPEFCPPAHPRVTAIPAFDDNYFWLITGDDGRHAAVVDPGSAEPVERVLRDRRLELAVILLTHHHADHTGGVADLVARWQPRVYGPAAESIPGVQHALREGDHITLEALGLVLDVHDVPGHTRGHIAYHTRQYGEDPRGLLFCGDTLFAAGCGRLFEGTPQQMLESLGKLAALPEETLVHCAHEYTLSNLRFAATVEPDNADITRRLDECRRLRAAGRSTVPSDIGIERRTNPFLRPAHAAVRRSAAARLGREPASTTETFAAIRGWKNEFR